MQSEVVFYPNCERNIANELNFYSIKVNGWYVKFLKVDALQEFHPSSMPIKTFATLMPALPLLRNLSHYNFLYFKKKVLRKHIIR
jgi:hypothetical protein